MSTLWGAIGIAVALWFATGWYLNERLRLVHQKLDQVFESFNGLREYLYEIDPQFNDERALLGDLFESVETNKMSFAGMEHMELKKRKEEQGFRTLNSSFFDGGFRAPNQ